MVSFTFSAEQLKAAPPDVRRWMEGEIVKALSEAPQPAWSAAKEPRPEPTESFEAGLAAGNAEEMAAVFAHISSNSIVSRVFFELAREPGFASAAEPLHVVDLSEIMRHLRLSDPKQIFACLDLITQAFQEVRGDREASLFAFDEAGHIYLQEATSSSIREVWQQLVTAHPWPATGHFQMPVSRIATAPVSKPEETAIRPEYAFSGTRNM